MRRTKGRIGSCSKTSGERSSRSGIFKLVGSDCNSPPASSSNQHHGCHSLSAFPPLPLRFHHPTPLSSDLLRLCCAELKFSTPSVQPTNQPSPRPSGTSPPAAGSAWS